MVGPTYTQFMDGDMRALWERLESLPGELRLYGGTALALYRNHRSSTDFDFATPLAAIDPDFIKSIPVLGEGVIRGGPGMVDILVRGASRDVNVTFMECGQMIPMPSQEPLAAPNGVAVAHPIDLTAAKIAACMSREASRDYVDVAECIRAWPDWTREAVAVLTKEGGVREVDVRRALADPPSGAAGELEAAARVTLRGFAQDFRMSQGRGGMQL